MNSPQHSPAALRQTWFVIFVFLCFSVLPYLLIGYLIEHGATVPRGNPQSLAALTPFIIPAAGLMLVASIAYLRFQVDGKIGGEGRPLTLSPTEFQTLSIIALALSEACSIFGLFLFFIGAPLQQLAYFVLATLFVNFAFVLPRGLRFWDAYARSINP